jgi:hypothetical protein
MSMYKIEFLTIMKCFGRLLSEQSSFYSFIQKEYPLSGLMNKNQSSLFPSAQIYSKFVIFILSLVFNVTNYFL